MKVLIVEDDTLLQQLFEKQIEILGHEVTAFQDAESALESYKSTFYDLVIVDVGLPEMDGLELCRHIRALSWRKHSMILVVTARDSLQDVQAALDAGADDYLTKPVNRTMFQVRLAVIERQMRTFARHRQEEEAIRQLVASLKKRTEEWTDELLQINGQLTERLAEHKREAPNL